MKKKIVTLIVIAIVSEIVAISGVFFVLYHFLNKGTVVNAVNVDTNSTNILPAYNSIYGNRFLQPANKSLDNIFYNINAEINIVKEKSLIQRALIKETLYFTSSEYFTSSDKENSGTVFLYVPSLNSSTTNIKNISSNRGVLNFKIKGLMLEIELGELLDNFLDSVTVEFEVLLNKNSGTISYSSKHVYLTNFLITPVVLKNGEPVLAFKSSFGDPYMYNMNNYRISFLVDNDATIFAPGEKTEQQNDDGKKLVSFEAKQLRDFPAVVLIDNQATNFIHDIQIEKVKNTEIYFINSRQAKTYVKEAFLFAYKNIGAYPYNKLFIVNADLSSISLRGMEFSNMIFISDDCFNDKEQLKRITYHEIFHQWFYGIIGTDQINEPFLDEGLVNYLAMYLAGDKLGNTYDSDFLKKNLTSYASKKDYYDLAYDDATVYFSNIHRQLGDNFFILLKTIYNDKKFSVLYYNEFMKYLAKFSQGGN